MTCTKSSDTFFQSEGIHNYFHSLKRRVKSSQQRTAQPSYCRSHVNLNVPIFPRFCHGMRWIVWWNKWESI
jgi:hypothetical protein